MIIRFENVKVESPRIDFNSRRRKGNAGQGSVKLLVTFQAISHAADLQRLTEGGEYAVSFTPMAEIISDAEKAMLGRVMATVIADAEAQGKAT